MTIRKIGRSYYPDYSQADPNRHTWEYSEKHSEVRILNRGYWLRKCDYPYDNREEHRLIMTFDNSFFTALDDAIRDLQKEGYDVIFNNNKIQSSPHLWHGHALRGYKDI